MNVRTLVPASSPSRPTEPFGEVVCGERDDPHPPHCRRERRHSGFARLDEARDKWDEQYPAIRNLWSNAWAEFVPFLDYWPEIRRVIYSTDGSRPVVWWK